MGDNLVAKVHCILIEPGENEAEIEANFDRIMKINDHIPRNSNIILDITHGFRSIPIFLYALIDFLETVRAKHQVNTEKIYYGMYKGPKHIAPMVDLSIVYSLTYWSHHLDNFIKFGNGFQLADQIQDQKLSEYIKDISIAFQTNNYRNLKRLLSSAQDYLTKIDKATLQGPEKYISQQLKLFLDRMQQPSNEDLLMEMAKWSLENLQYNNFYLYLVECIQVLIADALDINVKNSEKINQAIENLKHSKHPEIYRELAKLIKKIKV